MPVRGGGLKQGCNCQDAAADDRLMPGGFASACASDTVHAARLEQVALKGTQVVPGRTPIPATTWPAATPGCAPRKIPAIPATTSPPAMPR